MYVHNYEPVVKEWVLGQDLALHRHFPVGTAYQSVHSSPGFSKSPYQSTSAHQHYDPSPINYICTCQLRKYTLKHNYSHLTRFLIHLLAWPWGSINSGHRLENWTITPFSTERVSRGRPHICHDLIFTGFDNVKTRLTPSVWGTWYSVNACNHFFNKIALYSPCSEYIRATIMKILEYLDILCLLG